MVKEQYSATCSRVFSRIAGASAEPISCPYEVHYEEGVFRLLHYYPVTAKLYRTPILIVYAFINRPYVLDMHPDISVVLRYLEAGFDTYLIDWGYPTTADQFLTLDDYVQFISQTVIKVKDAAGGSNVNIHGYCLGGTLSTVYTALSEKHVRNLVLQAAPIDFHSDNTLALWAKALDADSIVNTYRMAPGNLLNTAFLLIDPINLIMRKYESLFGLVDSKEGLATFLRMDHWIFDSPAIPGEVFRQYVKEWYQRNTLIKGEFKALGQKVDLKKITVPVLVLAAKLDHIAPVKSQQVILDYISSRDKDIFEMGKGHIGITTSRESHKEFWPKVIDWLSMRSDMIEE